MLATPCSSFSLAISRSGRALRSSSHPRGEPIPMTHSERVRVADGNRALRATIRMIACCNQFRIPYALENPASSYLWKDPALQRVLSNAYLAKLHQCAFGARWKKATTIAFENCKGELPYFGSAMGLKAFWYQTLVATRIAVLLSKLDHHVKTKKCVALLVAERSEATGRACLFEVTRCAVWFLV